MKKIVIHPHAEARMQERGATEKEVVDTIQNGEFFTAKFGRLGFRRNFVYKKQWRGKVFNTKQLEVFVVEENKEYVVVTIIAKYF